MSNGVTTFSPVAPDVAERFWAKVDKSGDCWRWTAARSGSKPMFALAGTVCDARRVAWEFDGRGSLAGKSLRHVATCQPLCVRPDHQRVAVGTQTGRPGRSALDLLASRAEQALPREKPQRFDTSLITGPGGPNGSRYAPPDDLAPEPIATTTSAMDRALERAAIRSERDDVAGVMPREPKPRQRTRVDHTREHTCEQTPPASTIVGPFASGGFVAITPWGSFNGDTMLAVCASAEAGRPLPPRSRCPGNP